MKNYLKHIVKSFCTLFLFTCFMSCQKDEINIPMEGNTSNRSEKTVNKVKVNDIPALQSFVSTKMNGFPQKSNGNITYVETPFGIMPLEDITEVIDVDGNVNYTFKIYPNDPTPNTFYNLIVQPSRGKNDFVTFVLEYKMDEEFSDDLFFGRKQFGDFKGSIKKYSLDTFKEKTIMKSDDLPCPCSEIDISGGFGGPGGGPGGNGNGDNTDDSGDSTNPNGPIDWDPEDYEYTDQNGVSCELQIFPPCTQFGAHEGYCPTTWTVVYICDVSTEDKSLGKNNSDCPISDTGDCPNNSGEFGVDGLQLVEYLGITDRNTRMTLSFSANQDLADSAGNFLWNFRDNPDQLEIARAIVLDAVTKFVNGLSDKDESIRFLGSNNAERAVELSLEINNAVDNSLISSEEAGLLLSLSAENDWSLELASFSRDAILAISSGISVDFEDLYIAWETEDTSNMYIGVKKNIPNELVLSNGDTVQVTFGNSNDGVSADQEVAEELIDGLKIALQQANSKFTGTSTPKINKIYIKATTNGNHSPSSNHKTGTAVDISRINGVKMILATGSSLEQIKELQIALDNVSGVRENFGPHFKHKYFKEHDLWDYNYNVSGHKDHIHFSIRN